MRFAIKICGHPDWTRCAFSDYALALAGALRDLGHEVGAHSPGDRLVLLGVSSDDHEVPPGSVVVNTEQIDRGFKVPPQYRRSDVALWDYSRVNVERLAAHGIRAVHCPVGYHPSMERVPPADREDIDALFYGASCPSREQVLRAIRHKVRSVEWLRGAYGSERDEVISRSKVVLNLHFYPEPIHEVLRTGHLWANRRCVLTEDGGVDPEIEAIAREASAYAPRRGLADLVARLCATGERGEDLGVGERLAIAERGYEVFRKTSLVRSVERALDESAGVTGAW